MGKGEETRVAILDRAAALASVEGIEALSIGVLADAMGMSKSGVFAHFRSKDALDLAVLEHVRDKFTDRVVSPAFKAKRGVARVEALVERMVAWMDDPSLPGGCPLLASGFEFDDRPGPLRDFVANTQRDLLDLLTNAARIAIAEGEFRPGLDCEQVAFELHGAVLAAHQAKRLRGDARAAERFRTAARHVIEGARAR